VYDSVKTSLPSRLLEPEREVLLYRAVDDARGRAVIEGGEGVVTGVVYAYRDPLADGLKADEPA
jgi:hypothetical protein